MDKSDDEKVVSYAQVIVENPIFLIIMGDAFIISASEVNMKEPSLTHNPLVVPTSMTSVLKSENLASPPVCPSLLPTTITIRRYKTYDRSPIRRGALFAQRTVLKDLKIIRNAGELNGNVSLRLYRPSATVFATGPSRVFDRAFWDTMGENLLPLLVL